jgi:fructokinase
MKNTIWGVDLGGTKIEGAILDRESFEVLYRSKVPTQAEKGYAHVLNQICQLVDQLKFESRSEPTSIGICTPGILDSKSGLLKNCNATCLNGQAVKKNLEACLHVSVILANDANCFTLAETKLGRIASEYKAANVVFGIILGTGVGGGLVLNGKIWSGKNGIAGEWGHNPLEMNGSPCYCGKNGCNESVFSGPALEQYFLKLSGTKKSMVDIVKASASGKNIHAADTMEHFMKSLGKAVAQVINVLDPDVIVFGGGLSHIEMIYEKLHGFCAPWVFNDRIETPFLSPRLGPSAGLFGAALLCKESNI